MAGATTATEGSRVRRRAAFGHTVSALLTAANSARFSPPGRNQLLPEHADRQPGDQPFLAVCLRVGEESRIGRELPDRARPVAGAAPPEVGSASAAAQLVVELASALASAGV